MKKIFLGADGHCGADNGITPPAWQNSPAQEEAWDQFEMLLHLTGPFDLAVFNGDMVEGKASRQGSTDLITADRKLQCDIARTVIERVGASDNILTYGTPYHTGSGEDWEGVLADMVGCKIRDHAYINVEEVSFSIKHKISGSQIPHGRFTAMAREKLWDSIWAIEQKQHPVSQVLIRSHVHYHAFCGQRGPNWWLGINLPALQGLGGKYGARQCSGTIHWGFAWMTVDEGRIVEWDAKIINLQAQKDQVLVY